MAFVADVWSKMRKRASSVVYRTAGLPIAVRGLDRRKHTSERLVRRAYAARYWTIRSPGELIDLAIALVLWPVLLLALIAWCTARNGALVTRRSGRSISRQLADQIWLYFKAGVLPPSYYIYELHRQPVKRHARGFIQRCESKRGVPSLLKELRPPLSDLFDKAVFADQCARRGIATIPVLAVARGGRIDYHGSMRDLQRDLFVKPAEGKGGRGAERWDYLGCGRFRALDGTELDSHELLLAIAAKSLQGALLIQPRIENHPALAAPSNGALATVRVVTCLDERGEPELIGAVLRMAVGPNRLVDNLHAGGIAAAVDIESGRLGAATNLGVDSKMGWIERHPDSGAVIKGMCLPEWSSIAGLALRAHKAFSDRVLIGWDIAPTAEGPILVEGNGAPGLEIMQRAYRCGWMSGRLGQLLSHHVVRFGCVGLPEAA